MSRTAAAGRPPRQTPYRRTYANGRMVWIARFRDLDGKMRYAKPRWNGGKSTFALKGDAQRAIDEALDRLHGGADDPREDRRATSSAGWRTTHAPSAPTRPTPTASPACSTSRSTGGRSASGTSTSCAGARRSQLVDHMLRVEGRAGGGARGILSVALGDGRGRDRRRGGDPNAFSGIRLRRNDPGSESRRAKIRIWSFEQMRAFAAGDGRRCVPRLAARPSPRTQGPL